MNSCEDGTHAQIQPTKLQPPDHPSFQCITLKRLLPDTAQEDNHCRVRLRAMLMTRSAFPPRISPYVGPKMGNTSTLNQTWGWSSTSCRDYIPTYEVISILPSKSHWLAPGVSVLSKVFGSWSMQLGRNRLSRNAMGDCRPRGTIMKSGQPLGSNYSTVRLRTKCLYSNYMSHTSTYNGSLRASHWWSKKCKAQIGTAILKQSYSNFQTT